MFCHVHNRFWWEGSVVLKGKDLADSEAVLNKRYHVRPWISNSAATFSVNGSLSHSVYCT